MASNAREDVETLESGDIYFFYRPRVEHDQARGLEDIQNTYFVLSPHGRKLYRRAVIGRERLPDPSQRGGARFWGFVDAVTADPRALVEDFEAETYQTKTRGERHLPAARPAGEGLYRILRHGDHTHLVYALELPSEPAEVQSALNIEEEASYILSIKNPEKPSPPQAGLSSRQQPDYPHALRERFRDRRFANADPPEFLDHEGAEFILIAASEDVKQELGIDLHPQDEDESRAEIFRDLRLKKSQQPLAPLFEGVWR